VRFEFLNLVSLRVIKPTGKQCRVVWWKYEEGSEEGTSSFFSIQE